MKKITQQGFSTVDSGDENASAADVKKPEASAQEGGGLMGSLNEILFGTTGPRGVKKMVWCKLRLKAWLVRSVAH